MPLTVSIEFNNGIPDSAPNIQDQGIMFKTACDSSSGIKAPDETRIEEDGRSFVLNTC
jgi:hypothetical protein